MTTIMIECPECEGAGDVRHPRWGSRTCPSPEITCPLCRGRGEVTQDTAEEWEEENRPHHSDADLERLADEHSGYLDDEEPF